MFNAFNTKTFRRCRSIYKRAKPHTLNESRVRFFVFDVRLNVALKTFLISIFKRAPLGLLRPLLIRRLTRAFHTHKCLHPYTVVRHRHLDEYFFSTKYDEKPFSFLLWAFFSFQAYFRIISRSYVYFTRILILVRCHVLAKYVFDEKRREKVFDYDIARTIYNGRTSPSVGRL